ncbi:MAG: tryptophan--tRNA ligase [Candidatus Latescibacteria bacterium]|nr:tryptophan--tRNA ligase [Candidatus Latescibacterota bacterium]
MKKRVFSGIQPSGNLHIGNYIGAMRNWVAAQDQRDNIFCVVDQHAITVPYDRQALAQGTREAVGLYLAAGLDPQHCTIFVQSHIPEHTELAWLLTCLTPMGWLERMTQFKEKVGSQRERSGAGLFTYPVLMAADILLYQTHEVPVGDDQKQHVELARDLAQRFNHHFGETFVVPEPVIPKVGARIMGLDDATKKMSKSAEGQNHSISLLDEPKRIRKKLGRAVTDSQREIEFNPERPGVFNLLSMYQAFSGESKETIEARFADKGYGDLKGSLADLIIAELEPLQTRYREIIDDSGYIDQFLRQNAEKLRPIVNQTMDDVRQAMGFAPASRQD